MSQSEAYSIDVVVVGAGVIGLAVARTLALAGREVLVIEQEDHIAEHQSSRNSEVIHAGLYYAPGTLKAEMCLRGKALLYDYVARMGVPHRRVGKLLVATDPAQIAKLEAIRANARGCGMTDLHEIEAEEAKRWEPALRCVAALHSPSSGLVDSHAFMLALEGEAEANGASLAFSTPALRGAVEAKGIRLWTGGDQPAELLCRLLINAAGMFAPALAAKIEGYPAERVPRAGYAKGNYFSLTRRAPFSRLIYPVPEPGGLGVHLTLDLGGQARFGPDVEWIDAVDYAVDPKRGDRFYAAIRRYWPGLPDGALAPSYAGIRAKISPRDAVQDFVIETEAEHGVPGIVSLFGIESPGLTASLAIAELVARRVTELE